MGRIGGFCHLYIGQEAVATGAITALREDDYVITAYRDHAQALVRGISAEAVMAELHGRVGGASRGAGGSMHIFDRDVNPGREFPGRTRNRGNAPSGRGRRRLRHQVQGRRPGRAVLLRRLGGERGSVPRGLQHDGQVGAPRRVRGREQFLRHGHGHRPGGSGRRAFHPCLRVPGEEGRAGGRPGRSRSARRRIPCRRPGAQDVPAHLHRSSHLPIPRPLHVRSGARHVPEP